MLAGGAHVEFLATIQAVGVADKPDVLEHVQGPIDRRWCRLRVLLAAALDQLGPGDMAIGLGEDFDQLAALGRPSQAAVVEALPDVVPGAHPERRRGCETASPEG